MHAVRTCAARRRPGAPAVDARHRPEDTVLYAVLEEFAEAFFARLGEQGASLPPFVHQEFERYLQCGRLELDSDGEDALTQLQGASVR